MSSTRVDTQARAAVIVAVTLSAVSSGQRLALPIPVSTDMPPRDSGTHSATRSNSSRVRAS